MNPTRKTAALAAIVLTALATPVAVSAADPNAEEEGFSVAIGEPLKTQLGLYLDRENPPDEATKLNLRVEDNRFALIFLDAENRVIPAPESIQKVLIQTYALNDERDFEVRPMEPVGKDRLYYQASRYVRRPYRFRVRIVIERTKQETTPTTQSGTQEAIVTEAYGYTFMNQLPPEDDQ